MTPSGRSRVYVVLGCVFFCLAPVGVNGCVHGKRPRVQPPSKRVVGNVRERRKRAFLIFPPTFCSACVFFNCSNVLNLDISPFNVSCVCPLLTWRDGAVAVGTAVVCTLDQGSAFTFKGKYAPRVLFSWHQGKEKETTAYTNWKHSCQPGRESYLTSGMSTTTRSGSPLSFILAGREV